MKLINVKGQLIDVNSILSFDKVQIHKDYDENDDCIYLKAIIKINFINKEKTKIVFCDKIDYDWYKSDEDPIFKNQLKEKIEDLQKESIKVIEFIVSQITDNSIKEIPFYDEKDKVTIIGFYYTDEISYADSGD